MSDDNIWNEAIRAAIRYVENCTIAEQGLPRVPRDSAWIALGMEVLLRGTPDNHEKTFSLPADEFDKVFGQNEGRK